MKYVSIDIETTGLSPKDDQVLEFAAIIEDTSKPLSFEKIPKFSAILYHERIFGSPFALNLNSRIIKILSEIPCPIKNGGEWLTYFREHNILEPKVLGHRFANWLHDNGIRSDSNGKVKIIPAGKNFDSFDRNFLNNLEGFNGNIKLHHRSLNPAILYTDFINDTEPPSLGECKKRAGLPEVVTHKALDDAWDVILLIRNKCK